MSASTDALNKAVDDLGAASHAMLDKIAAEAAHIDDQLKNDNTPEVDAATARIVAMTNELKDKLGALSTSAAAVSTDAPATSASVVNTDVPATPLAGVPVTPQSTAPALGAVVPNTDFVVTETSPNQDTSGPAVLPGAESAPGVSNSLAGAEGSDFRPVDQPDATSPAEGPVGPAPTAEDAPAVSKAAVEDAPAETESAKADAEAKK